MRTNKLTYAYISQNWTKVCYYYDSFEAYAKECYNLSEKDLKLLQEKDELYTNVLGHLHGSKSIPPYNIDSNGVVTWIGIPDKKERFRLRYKDGIFHLLTLHDGLLETTWRLSEDEVTSLKNVVDKTIKVVEVCKGNVSIRATLGSSPIKAWLQRQGVTLYNKGYNERIRLHVKHLSQLSKVLTLPKIKETNDDTSV